MTAERLFSIVNLIAAASWLPLIFIPRSRWATRIVPIGVPLVFSVTYLALIVWSLPGNQGGFSSLAGVSTLFENQWALLAGWTHYLAFDLFIGGWELRDSQRRQIPHLAMVPVLMLTFLLGPIGFLLYFAIRSFASKGGASAAFDAE